MTDGKVNFLQANQLISSNEGNKFVDLEGLRVFWANAKSYIDTADSAINVTLTENNVDGQLVKLEITPDVAGREFTLTLDETALAQKLSDFENDAKTYSISKVANITDENVKEAFQLVDEDGTPCGETINIYKDSSLIDVELVAEDADGNPGQFLKYTYVLANGTEKTEYVNVSQFLVEAEFKNGLEVSAAGEVSVKIDATSESFLTVGEGGVKLAGVQAAINAGDEATLTAAKKYTDEEVAKEADKRAEEDGKLDVRVTDLEKTVNGYGEGDDHVDGLVERVETIETTIENLLGEDGDIQDMIDASIEKNNTEYVDVQDAATLASAKAYADNIKLEITVATEAEIDALFA